MFDRWPTVASVREADPFALAAGLSTLSLEDLVALSADEAESVVAATQRVINAMAARQAAAVDTFAARVDEDLQRHHAELMADLDARAVATGAADRPPRMVVVPGCGQVAASMLAPVLRVAPRTMATRMRRAGELIEDLPRTYAAAWAGDLEPWRADAVARGSAAVRREHLVELEARVFAHDVCELTGPALAERTRRAALKADPEGVAAAVRDGARRRRVVVRPGELAWPTGPSICPRPFPTGCGQPSTPSPRSTSPPSPPTLSTPRAPTPSAIWCLPKHGSRPASSSSCPPSPPGRSGAVGSWCPSRRGPSAGIRSDARGDAVRRVVAADRHGQRPRVGAGVPGRCRAPGRPQPPSRPRRAWRGVVRARGAPRPASRSAAAGRPRPSARRPRRAGPAKRWATRLGRWSTEGAAPLPASGRARRPGAAPRRHLPVPRLRHPRRAVRARPRAARSRADPPARTTSSASARPTTGSSTTPAGDCGSEPTDRPSGRRRTGAATRPCPEPCTTRRPEATPATTGRAAPRPQAPGTRPRRGRPRAARGPRHTRSAGMPSRTRVRPWPRPAAPPPTATARAARG